MFAGLFSIIVMMNVQASEIPPRDSLKLLTSGNTKYYTTFPEPWNGIFYTEYITPKPIGVSVETLLSLVYTRDEIPGLIIDTLFGSTPNDKAHTRIFLRDTYASISRYHSSEEMYKQKNSHSDKRILSLPMRMLNVGATVYKVSTKEIIEKIESNRRKAQVPYDMQKEYPLPTGNVLGNQMWLTSPNEIRFVKGKTEINVQFSDKTQDTLTDNQRMYLEAVAWGVLYRILHYPDISGEKNASMNVIHKASRSQLGKATNVQGVAMVPATTLKKAGVTIKTTRDENKWTMSLTKGKRTVTVNAFDWFLYENGKPKRLNRPVFPHNNDLVVPLRSACDALEIEIEVSGNNVIIN